MQLAIFPEVRKLFTFDELIVNLTLREIKAKYKQAFFGITWALVQPVVMMGMMTVVFSYLAKVPSDGLPYPLFVFAALLPWQFFAGAVNRGAGSLVNQAALIAKVYFPRECLVLASFLAALVDLAITAIVFVVLLVYYRFVPGATWLWVVPLFAVQLMLTLGLMLFLAPLNAMYRDVGQAIPLAIQVLMYATPIMYPATLVPAHIRSIYFLNPMAVLIDGYRSTMFRGQPPDGGHFAYALVVSAFVLITGYVVFKKFERQIADVA